MPKVKRISNEFINDTIYAEVNSNSIKYIVVHKYSFGIQTIGMSITKRFIDIVEKKLNCTFDYIRDDYIVFNANLNWEYYKADSEPVSKSKINTLIRSHITAILIDKIEYHEQSLVIYFKEHMPHLSSKLVEELSKYDIRLDSMSSIALGFEADKRIEFVK